MDEPTDENRAPEGLLRASGEQLGGRGAYGRGTLEAAIPSLGKTLLVVAGAVALGVIGRQATRRAIVGDQISYERYERTPDGHEVYERFERGTILTQRG